MTKRTIHQLLSVRRRVPFLKNLLAELKRMGDGQGNFQVRNELAWKMANDHRSMLVIEAYSLRQRLTKKETAIINALKDHLTRLKRFEPRLNLEDTALIVGENTTQEDQRWLNEVLREDQA